MIERINTLTEIYHLIVNNPNFNNQELANIIIGLIHDAEEMLEKEAEYIKDVKL
jgi:hypothetical protein